jgi:hypothetical protein
LFLRPIHYEELQQDAPDVTGNSDLLLERRWQSAINPKRSRRLLLLKYEKKRL